MTGRRLLGSSVAPVVVGYLGVALILLWHDIGLLMLAKYTGYLVIVVGAPGVFAWRALLSQWRRSLDAPPTMLEDVVLGAIFGFSLQLPLYLLGVWIGRPRLFLALPLIVAALSIATWGRRVWTAPTQRLDVRASWCLSAIIVYGAGYLAHNVFPRHPLDMPINRASRIDETFHESLIADIMHRFPPQIPYVLGTRLDYHWFVHAQLAATRWATEIGSPPLLREILPVTALALTVLGLAAVAMRLTGRSVAAVLAPALLVVGSFAMMGTRYSAGRFTEPFLSWRLVSSPSQAYGFAIALPAIYLIMEVLRPGRRPAWLTWLALVLALLGLSGAKATFMPIFLCGAALLWAVLLVARRRVDVVVSGLIAALLAITVFAQTVLLGGDTGALALNPFLSIKQALRSQAIAVDDVSVTVLSVAMLVGWLLYGAGAVGLIRGGAWRDPRALWLLFCIPTGVAVVFAFARSGGSQYWFQRSVAELVALISAWGLARLLPDPLPRRLAAVLVAIALAGGAVVFAVTQYTQSKKYEPSLASYGELIATAVVPFALIAVYLAARRHPWLRARPRAALAGFLAVLLGLSTSHVYGLAYTVVAGPPVEAPEHELFADGGLTAAQWVADNSGPDDVVATNVHCASPFERPCDNRNFWIAAFTERRVVIEGWGYTQPTRDDTSEGASATHTAPPDPERLRINDDAFDHPSAATVRRLVDTYDVEYLFVDKQYPVRMRALNQLDSVVRRVFNNENYAVFKVVAGGG